MKSVLAWGILPLAVIMTILLELAYEKITSKNKKSLEGNEFGITERQNDGCMVSLRMIFFGIVSIGACVIILRNFL